MSNDLKVIKKFKCKCGAITLWFSNGATNSMSAKTYARLPKEYHTKDYKAEKLWACDKCCNHYSIEDGNQKLGEIQITSCLFGRGGHFKNRHYCTE